MWSKSIMSDNVYVLDTLSKKQHSYTSKLVLRGAFGSPKLYNSYHLSGVYIKERWTT